MSRIRNGIYIGIPIFVMMAIVAIVFIPFNLEPSHDQEIHIASVDRGNVVMTYEGEGIVEPQSEVLILSPGSSIIKEILKEVGTHVNEGESIMILDPSPIQTQIENIRDQLEMKQNSLTKNRLNARSTKVDLDYNVQVKKLRIASLKSELTDQEQLLEVGGISPARFERTKQELELAEQDLIMLQEKNSIKLQQLEADEEGLRLQIQMQEKELAMKQEALGKMIIRAPSAGIILSIRGKVGEKVENDRLLIEMSDLSNFKIRGTVDDDYSELLKTGTGVYVALDSETLSGVVGTVNPVIRDRKIEFDVYLKESSHYKLRPNMNVILHIVREERDSVLRIPNGPAIGRGETHQLFVMGDRKASERLVRTGLKTDDYVEVLEGLSEGERVVLSNVASLEDLEVMEVP